MKKKGIHADFFCSDFNLTILSECFISDKRNSFAVEYNNSSKENLEFFCV